MIFEHVSKSYGQTEVLRDLSLTLPERGIVGFFGPSGSGKTTIFHLISKLLVPDSGRIEGQGRVSVVFQEDRLLPWISAAENIEAVTGIKGSASSYLNLVQLFGSEKKYPDELSGGQKRRVALARALAYDAKVLLLDEPFNGIDEETKEGIYPLIIERARDSLVLIATHVSQELCRLCDRIYLLSGPPVLIKEVLDHENIQKKFCG
ncbi:Aliphatic sulfonates import ATP-binding protein SsuB [bioreactor metagenome]|uniref:Aliphatic sulfonates import ATP-binding protein SsuB n=1 Tax=bioreactor metagenome TaxID=1076179 RepID=A0A645FLK9_9ZZZZ